MVDTPKESNGDKATEDTPLEKQPKRRRPRRPRHRRRHRPSRPRCESRRPGSVFLLV